MSDPVLAAFMRAVRLFLQVPVPRLVCCRCRAMPTLLLPSSSPMPWLRASQVGGCIWQKTVDTVANAPRLLMSLAPLDPMPVGAASCSFSSLTGHTTWVQVPSSSRYSRSLTSWQRRPSSCRPAERSSSTRYTRASWRRRCLRPWCRSWPRVRLVVTVVQSASHSARRLCTGAGGCALASSDCPQHPVEQCSGSCLPDI